MSKSLTEEYKVVMQAEVPDLWARIEASLPEKDLHINDNDNLLDFDKGKMEIKGKISKDINKDKNTKKLTRFIYSLSGVAVAGIAIALLIPFIADNKMRMATASEAMSSRQEFAGNSSHGKRESDSKNSVMSDTTADCATAATSDEMMAGTATNDYEINRNDSDIKETLTSIASDGAVVESELMDSYKAVSFEILGDTEIEGNKYYEIRVLECESNVELVETVLIIDYVEGLDSSEIYTYDLSLARIISDKNIYFFVLE